MQGRERYEAAARETGTGRVLVTGASGFVGGYVCKRLMAEGWDVIGLSRSADPAMPAGVEEAQGDVAAGEGLAEACSSVDAVIHLVGIIRERGKATYERVHVDGTRNVLAAAQEAGVRRYVHMSAVGADPKSASGYASTKGAAEALVRESGLAWTILRPSLIFGVGDDFFGRVLRELVEKPPVVPVVGDGRFPFSPVWIEDVATAFERALRRPATEGKTFEVVGPQEYTLRELLAMIREALALRKPLVNVPLPLMRLGTQVFRLLPNPPITRDELVMLLNGNTGDPWPAAEAFGLDLARLGDHLYEILTRARQAS